MNKYLLLQQDKANHAFYGLAIYCFLHLFISSFLAIGIVVIIAISKEIYDAQHPDKHTADYKDVVFTVVTPVILALLELLSK